MDRIAESEMILNDRGAIYHLDLCPGELAPLVITVGDPGRVPEVSKHFDRVEHRSSHREFNTHTGYIGKKRLSVVSTGIGPDNIDITLNELDALVNIDFDARTIKKDLTALTIVRMGTCGGLQPDIPTDGLIASSHGLGLDNLMHYYKFGQTREEDIIINTFIEHADLYKKHIIPYLVQGNNDLLQAFIKAGYFHGITATCPGFYAPQGRMLRIPVNFPDLPEKLSSFRYRDFRITNFEMETSAIYGLGKLMGHQCLSINTVVANRATHQFSKDSKKAIEKMIAKSLETLLDL
ncbi:MAG: phosphorylase [Chitinophagaceae bacterium]|nr:MAG: phosphorylase [Chitinophagaceae bacterium]